MRHHRERHRSEHRGWLRAAVLGANDGIVSTASLLVGVAAAGGDRSALLIAGIAGVVAGAMSMAAGEYVSVSSQGDSERADLALEASELAADPEGEVRELAVLLQHRGLQPPLAREVALALSAHDALDAHAREELGIFERIQARPLQAAIASAAAFAGGALVPIVVVVLAPVGRAAPVLAVTTFACLAALGALAAWVGGARIARGVVRVTAWGGAAMALTWLIGRLVGTQL